MAVVEAANGSRHCHKKEACCRTYQGCRNGRHFSKASAVGRATSSSSSTKARS